VFYSNGWSNDTVHARSNWTFAQYNKDAKEVVPSQAHGFYKSIFSNAIRWGMRMLFADFLAFRGGWARRAPGIEGDEGEHQWLGGMTLAAQERGIEVQWCMAAAHQVSSLQAHKLMQLYTNTDYCLVAFCTWILITRF
jgi:hypothetical protein